jgi:SAM-dependent methyltransferase
MDNRKFWNERYQRLPQLGSGPGSRAYAAWIKQRLIRDVVANHRIRSILDIGCGDLCWLQEDLIESVAYCGCDISDVIVERNRARFPQLKFMLHDVAAAPLQQTAELVVCFDVLIHQIELEAFQRTLRHVLAAVSCIGLISYLTPGGSSATTMPDAPAEVLLEEEELLRLLKDPSFPRAQTAFHGNLTGEIARIAPELGAKAVGAYPAQTIYEVTRASAHLPSG